MSDFTPAEINYLKNQRLGRLATVGPEGQPHVVPVAFRYNSDLDTIDIGGHGFAKRKKYRDVGKNPKVAFVIDDLASIDPWRARGIEVRDNPAWLRSRNVPHYPTPDRQLGY
jgi:pyridoxamine 5'-phosphate oxidase family protein